MEINFKPFPRQWEALQLLMDDKTNEVLYGGGARGGKSYLGNAWIITQALSKPGSTWLVGRKRFSDLRDTTLITFHEVLADFGVEHLCNYNGQEKRATFTNGSIVFFKDIDYEPSDPLYNRLGSYNLTGDFLDEAQEINVKAINVLRGRFSNLEGEGWKTIPKSFYSCNPDKGWVYSDFYKPHRDGHMPDDKAFIPALATDNPYISQDYIKNLAKSDEVTVQRLLYGNFEYDNDPTTLVDATAMMNLWSNAVSEKGTRYITADIARYGKDKTVIYVWHEYDLKDYATIETSSLQIVAEKIRELSQKHNIPFFNVIVDEDGVGGGVVDMLMGVKGFMANKKPFPVKDLGKLVPANYQNLKTQCGYKLAEMINRHEIKITPTDFRDELVQELGQLKTKDADKDGKLKLYPKEEIKKMIGRSPDYLDAMIMRMFFEFKTSPNLTVNYQEPDMVANSAM